jgi:hypothetical protein
MHPRPPCRLADRLGVIAIVLGALDVGFDVLRRDQTNLVAKRGQFASPMVSAATGFRSNLGGGKLRKEGDELRTAEIDPQYRPILLIDAMEGKDRFGRVDGNAFILRHIPARSTAVSGSEAGPLAQRDRHLEMITDQGRLAGQEAIGKGLRALVETTMGRYKALIGPRLPARGFPLQQTEAAIGVEVLNCMLASGRPKSVRCQRVSA